MKKFTNSSNGSVVTLRNTYSVRWEPQEDITAYELALCMNIFHRNMGFYEEDFEKLEIGVKRHWKLNK